MEWIKTHKNDWRIAFLVLLGLAVIGPWFFDKIFVPAQYTCSAPNYRLYGDFCGIPMPGFYVIWMLALGSLGVFSGEPAWRIARMVLMLIVLLLPFASSLLLVLRGESMRRKAFHFVACGLAGILGLVWGLSNYPELFWVLWGLWMYILLVTVSIVIETAGLARNRRPGIA